MLSTLTLLAFATNAHAFDTQTVDGWEYEGEEVQYLDEDYEAGNDFDKVVGGKQVSTNRWDSTVGVVMGGYVGCTGTLIHPKVALTAAHCVGGINGIVIDSDNWIEANDNQVVPVVDEILHPDYYTSQWGGNDIAVLILGERVTRVPTSPVALECVVDEYVKDKAQVEIVGYGVTSESGNGFNSLLNHGGTRVQTADCTATEVDGIFTGCDPAIAPGGEIGAGGNGVDACFGDSGGPLYLKADIGDFLVGVTSRAYLGVPGNAPCAYGGIYTRPDYYVKWIEDTANIKLRYNYCNLAPDVLADGIVSKPGKTGYTALIVSDLDGDPGAATYAVVEEPLHGTVTIDVDGIVAYTADEDYTGPDSFTVSVTDAGNPSYKRTGEPISMELEIPVEVKKGLFVSPSNVDGAGCGCSTEGTPATGWFGLVGALALFRRRRD